MLRAFVFLYVSFVCAGLRLASGIHAKRVILFPSGKLFVFVHVCINTEEGLS